MEVGKSKAAVEVLLKWYRLTETAVLTARCAMFKIRHLLMLLWGDLCLEPIYFQIIFFVQDSQFGSKEPALRKRVGIRHLNW